MSREGKSPWVILNAHYLIKLGTFVRASTQKFHKPKNLSLPPGTDPDKGTAEKVVPSLKASKERVGKIACHTKNLHHPYI